MNMLHICLLNNHILRRIYKKFFSVHCTSGRMTSTEKRVML
jgi:hypothetical protein